MSTSSRGRSSSTGSANAAAEQSVSIVSDCLKGAQSFRLLEQRIVFDGAALVTHADTTAGEHSTAPGADADGHGSGAAGELLAALAETPAGEAREAAVVVFIDAAVDDPAVIAAAAPLGAEIVTLEADRDGLEQIAAHLAGRTGIDAIHIVSHGRAGELDLGNAHVTLASIAGPHADELAVIRAALGSDGDIFLYGCDVAAGDTGKTFISALAAATDADVAASIDATGSAALGGDWVLERNVGLIEARSLDAREWSGLLAPFNISATSAPVVRDNTGTIVAAVTGGDGVVRHITDTTKMVGATAIWANAGYVGGTPIDLVATVLSVTDTNPNVGQDPTLNFAISNGDDPSVRIENAEVRIKWSAYAAGTYDPVTGTGTVAQGDVGFFIRDIDAFGHLYNASGVKTFQNMTGIKPQESVRAEFNELDSYQAEAPGVTHLTIGLNIDPDTGATITDPLHPSFNRITATNLVDTELAGSVSGVKFNWNDVSTWEVTYRVAPPPGLTFFDAVPTNGIADGSLSGTSHGQRFFDHDGDGDLTFVSPQTVYMRQLDLDASNNTASGTSYQATFTENGSAVAVVDTDVDITGLDTNVVSATVVLTNAKPGDELLVAGSTAASGTVNGLTYTITSSGGQITVELAGATTDPTVYETALKQITFRNSSESPDTADRQIEVSFSNGSVSSGTAISTIHVVPVNDPPAGVDDTIAVIEDTPVTVNVLGNDTDPESDPLTISSAEIDWNGDGVPDPLVLGTPTAMVTSTGATIGIITVNANGDVTFAPAQEYTGPVPSLTYTPNDGTVDGSPATVSFGPITPVNDPPVAVPGTSSGDEDTQIPVSLAGTDVDGIVDFVTVEELPDPSEGILYMPDGMTPVAVGTPIAVADAASLVFVPAPDFNGMVTVLFTVTDDDGAVSDLADVLITVDPVQDAPVATANVYTVVEDQYLSGDVILDDTGAGPDHDADGDSLVVTGLVVDGVSYAIDTDIAITGVGSLVMSGDGSFYFQPVQDFAGHVPTVTYTIADGNGGSSSATLDITVTPVDDVPVPLELQIYTNEDVAYTNGQLDAYNPDGDTLTFGAGSTMPANGTVMISADGSFVYTPTANFSGTDTFSYTVSDGTTTIEQLVTVTVYPVADAPEGADKSVTIDEDTTYTFSAADFGFSDPNDDPSHNFDKLIITTLPASGTLTLAGMSVTAGQVIAAADIGQLVFTPDANSDGMPLTSFTFQVVDDGLAATGNLLVNGSLEDAPFGVPSAVIPAYYGTTPPTAADLNPAGLEGWTRVVTFEPWDGTYSMVGTNLETNADPATTDTPFGDQFGFRGHVYQTVTGLEPGETYTVSGWAIVNIDPATLDPNAFVVPIFGIQVFDDAAFDGTIDYSIYQPTLAEGWLEGWNGVSPFWREVSFTFTAPASGKIDLVVMKDSSVAMACNWDNISLVKTGAGENTDPVPNTFTINVDPINDPPVSTPLSDLANADSDIVSVDLSGSFSDPDSSDTLTFSATGLPPGLSIDPDTGVITGTIDHDASVTGPYAVTVTAVDPTGATTQQTFTWTVVNLPPVAVDDAASVGEDAFSLGGNVILGAGTDHDTAPDSDPLTVVSAAQAGNGITLGVPFTTAGGGVLILNPDGGYQFFPGTAYNGLDVGETATETIGYVITDGNGGTAAATLVITIVGANDAPVVVDPSNPGTPASPVPAGDPLNIIPDVSTTDGATPAPVNVGSYIVDPDGEPLTFTATGLPAGMVIDPVTGIITGTLPNDASQSGPYTVIVTATDPDGAAVQTTVTYTVVNLPPVAVDDAASVGEDAFSLGGNVILGAGTDHDTAPDSDPLTVVSAAQAGNGITLGVPFTTAGGGVLILNPDGGYQLFPGTAYNGLDVGETATETIGYVITDGNGGTAAATLVITIVGANDAPVVVDPSNPGTPASPVPAGDPLNIIPDVSTTDGATPAPVNVGSYIVDPDGEPLTFTATGLPAGMVIDPVTGIITGTLPNDASQSGPYTVIVTATDPDGAAVQTTVTYTVVNLPPVAVDDAASVGEDAFSLGGNVILGAGTDHDTAPDSDPLTVVSAAQAGNGITLGVPFTTAGGGVLILNPDGGYQLFPGTAYNGLDVGETATETIGYVITDGNGGTAAATLVITIVGANDAPVVVDPSNPGTPASPVPAGDPLNIIPDVSTTDGATPAPVNVGSYIVDPDGEPLTFTATGLPAGMVIDPVTGIITGTLPNDASQSGPYTVIVTATDPDGAAVQTTVTYTVVNLPPVAVDDAASVGEDAFSLGGNVILGAGTDHDTAPDSDPLTVVSAAQAGNGITLGVPFTTAGGGVLILNPDGGYQLFPGTAYNGLDVGETATETIGYVITDGNGGTAAATLVITIVGANDAPIVVDPSNPGTPASPVPAGDPLNIIPDVSTTDGATPAPVNVGSYIVDPDGEPLTFTATGLPAGMVIDPVTGIITGTLPNDASQSGPYTVIVTATDPDGAAVQTTVTYTVVNLPPVAVDDAASVGEDAFSLGGNVILGAGTDHDTAPDSDPLTVVSAAQAGNGITLGVPFTTAGGGVLILNPDGGYQLFPGTAYNGLDVGETATETIGYVITDGNGGTAAATLVITIVGANDAPVAVDDVVPVTEDAPVGGDLIGNDHDADGDPLTVIAFTVGGVPYAPGETVVLPEGTLTIEASGTWTFVPAPNYHGPLPAVTYTIADDSGATSTANLVLGPVAPVNDPPVPLDDTATTLQDHPVSISVLDNDSDVDGDRLTVVMATSSDGTVVVNPDGTLTFRPSPAFHGSAIITYVVSDGQGGTATATATVRVTVLEVPNPGLGAPVSPLAPTPMPSIEPIAVDGMVVDTVAAIGGLNSTSSMSEHGIVVDTVEGIASLGGTLGADQAARPASATPLEQGRVWQIEGVLREAGAERALTGAIPGGLHGFSLRLGLLGDRDDETARSQVIVETLVRDRTLIVSLSSRIADPDRTVSEYRVMQGNGAPLPGWLQRVGGGLLVGQRPADLEALTLRVIVIYSDGTSETREVRIEASSGEIGALERPRGASIAVPFAEQFARLDPLSDASVRELAWLLAG